MTDTPDPNATTCPECGLPLADDIDVDDFEFCLAAFADDEDARFELSCNERTIARLKSELAAKDGRIAGLEAGRDARQMAVYAWALETFGEGAAHSKERVLRFLEEAIELAQAEGISIEQTSALAFHVHGKPAGEPHQEAGGVGITLLAYCESLGFSADQAEQIEWARVLTKDAAHFRERHNIKARAGVATFAVDDALAGKETG